MRAVFPLPGNAGYHAVHFYTSIKRLRETVADFLADGIAAAQPLVMVATPLHREMILTELRSRRFDVAALQSSQRLHCHDAEEVLSRISINGEPDRARFHDVVGLILDNASDPRHPTTRTYSEMVNVLWNAGRRESALTLERLWNELARTHRFSLLHSYPDAPQASQKERTAMSAEHTHVCY